MCRKKCFCGKRRGTAWRLTHILQDRERQSLSMKRNRYALERYLNSHCTVVSGQTAEHKLCKQTKKQEEQAQSITLVSACLTSPKHGESSHGATSHLSSLSLWPYRHRYAPNDPLIIVTALQLLPQLGVLLPRQFPEQIQAWLSFVPSSQWRTIFDPKAHYSRGRRKIISHFDLHRS